jgi:TPR repeat protein
MKQAADGDDPAANYWVAYWSKDGKYMPVDDVLAYFYANRAIALGDQHGHKILRELEQRMSRQEIAEAQKMTREWAARSRK